MFQGLRFSFLLVLIILMLSACTAFQTGGQPQPAAPPSSKAPSGPDQRDADLQRQKAALVDRAQAYWNYRVKDYTQCYPFETPAYRERFDLAHYVRTYPGEVMYHSAKVRDVNIQGNMAAVAIDITYSYMFIKISGGLASTIADYWELHEDGVWYHHFAPPPVEKRPPIGTF